MTEHASQNEIVWNGQVLSKNIQEFEIESDDLEINGYTVCDVYEIFSASNIPQMGYISDDSEDRRVIKQSLFFQRRHSLAKYPNDRKEDWPDLVGVIYHFDKPNSPVGIQVSKADWRKGQKSLQVYSNAAEFEYNPETGELETIELPVPNIEGSDDPVFYPRIKYNLKLQTYVGREDKPLKTNSKKPEIKTVDANISIITFNTDGVNQILRVPISLKNNEQNPFNQFADLNTNDWVNPKLLEVLQTFSSTN